MVLRLERRESVSHGGARVFEDGRTRSTARRRFAAADGRFSHRESVCGDRDFKRGGPRSSASRRSTGIDGKFSHHRTLETPKSNTDRRDWNRGDVDSLNALEDETRFRIEAKTFRLQLSRSKLIQIGEVKGRNEFRFWLNRSALQWFCDCLKKAIEFSTPWRQDFEEGKQAFSFSVELNASGFFARLQEIRQEGRIWVIVPEGKSKFGYRVFLSELMKFKLNLEKDPLVSADCTCLCENRQNAEERHLPSTPSQLLLEADLTEMGITPFLHASVLDDRLNASRRLTQLNSLCAMSPCYCCSKEEGHGQVPAKGDMSLEKAKTSDEISCGLVGKPNGRQQTGTTFTEGKKQQPPQPSKEPQPLKGVNTEGQKQQSTQSCQIQAPHPVPHERLGHFAQICTDKMDGADTNLRSSQGHPAVAFIRPLEKTTSKLDSLLSANLGSLSVPKLASESQSTSKGNATLIKSAVPTQHPTAATQTGSMLGSQNIEGQTFNISGRDVGAPTLLNGNTHIDTPGNGKVDGHVASDSVCSGNKPKGKQADGRTEGFNAFKRMATSGLKNVFNAGRSAAVSYLKSKDQERSDQGKSAESFNNVPFAIGSHRIESKPMRVFTSQLNVNATPFEPLSFTLEEGNIEAVPDLDEAHLMILADKGNEVCVAEVCDEEDRAIHDRVSEEPNDFKIGKGGKANKGKKAKSKKKRR